MNTKIFINCLTSGEDWENVEEEGGRENRLQLYDPEQEGVQESKHLWQTHFAS